MDVKFFRATDAFLYLPTYIAEHRGIYDEIDPSLNVTFHTPGAPDSNDQSALFAMIQESQSNGDSVPVAVCDPFIMFRCNLSGFGIAPENLRVIGALITKVPFWGVDKVKAKIREVDLGKTFDRVIYYNDKLLTGHYVGMQTRKNGGIEDWESVYFGQEFNYLFDGSRKKTIAITSDIISMALYKEHSDPSKQTSINCSFADNEQYKDFITTALVTTSDVCERYPNQLQKVMEGIQGALSILRSSRKIAHSVCKQLATRREFYHPLQLAMIGGNPGLTSTQIDFMLDCIYEGDFFARSLGITQNQWAETLDKHAMCLGAYRDEFERGKALYNPIVDNTFLIGGQQQYMVRCGLDIETLAGNKIAAKVETALTKERILPQNLFSDIRVASRLSFGLAAASALTICFYPSLNFLWLRVITLALAAFLPLSSIGAWVRKHTNFLNSKTILLLLSLLLFGACALLLRATLKAIDANTNSTSLAIYCSLAGSACIAALQLWWQAPNDK